MRGKPSIHELASQMSGKQSAPRKAFAWQGNMTGLQDLAFINLQQLSELGSAPLGQEVCVEPAHRQRIAAPLSHTTGHRMPGWSSPPTPPSVNPLLASLSMPVERNTSSLKFVITNM